MIDYILEVFKNEIDSLKLYFKNDRDFLLLTKEDVLCEGDDYFFACVAFDNNEVIICYNDDNLNEFIEGSNCKINKLKPLFKFFSHHEYGHTTIAPNISELKNININRDFHYTLKNFDVSLYQKSFREFYADLFASKINKKMLKVYLNYKSDIIKLHLEDLEQYVRNFSNLCNFILNLIEFVNTFYAFKKWKCLINIFEKNDEIELLNVLHLICSKYERIVEENEDYKSKMKNLLGISIEIEREINKLFEKYNNNIDQDSWY